MKRVKGYSKELMNVQLQLIFEEIQLLATAALDIEDNTVEGTREELMEEFFLSIDKLTRTLNETKEIMGGLVN
jgi:hypothetical protein|tara:strand:- start:32 stop:250 length:219 start_codon:yes stop_codon:yes gene_type:complete